MSLKAIFGEYLGVLCTGPYLTRQIQRWPLLYPSRYIISSSNSV